jgi:hypothetical protein
MSPKPTGAKGVRPTSCAGLPHWMMRPRPVSPFFRVDRIKVKTAHNPCAPVRLLPPSERPFPHRTLKATLMQVTRTPFPINASPVAKQEIAEQARQLMRLREFAASATTARVKARLLDEAAALERMLKRAGLGAI